MELIEALVKKVYEIAIKHHKQYCDYPCFTREDIRQYLVHKLSGTFSAEPQGSSVIVPWGSFGNTSYDHFLSSVNYALSKILEKLEFDP